MKLFIVKTKEYLVRTNTPLFPMELCVRERRKKIGKKITETDKQIREKSKKTLDILKEKIKKKE